MLNASDLRKGLKIDIENEPWEIVHFEFRKPGKGQSLYRCKLKNMIQGNTQEITYRSVDKIKKADMFNKPMIYSYQEGDNYVFMDSETYEQTYIHKDIMGDNRLLLNDDIECDVLLYNGKPIEVILPNFLEKEIIKTEPGFKGDTATNTLKPAWIENNVEIQVPLFIEQGEKIKIDTRTNEYAERV
ncbi:MAG: elongation factor P [Verrucomicrobiota bacterium]|nr:elongation factor P [Verrucomicrobiota bacterium]